MPVVCPTCGEQNSEMARFCQGCGMSLVPEEHSPEERKVVSVLFVDLVDFTSRSDQADPEDVRATLRPYHARVKAEIESFGGVVEKFIGDAVMAVFGAPVSHGDDAERAVRAGLRVMDAIQELNAESPDLDLTVRAAVNTGEAIVDARATPDVAQGLAHGDVVNTASRLQTGAPPGALVVGEETYRATNKVIAYDPIDPIQAKGKREPLAAWQAVKTLTAPAERAASAAPMVGRDRELDLLRNLWDSVMSERRPRLVTVIGPPGIGKTRLTGEFRAAVESSGARVVRGRSLPYGENSGYRAFSQQIKDVAGIFETDSPLEARAKLERLVAAVASGEEAQEIGEHLMVLVGLATNGVAADRQLLFFSARRFVELLANQRPVLLVFEDIHWADPSQLDLMEFLASRVRDAPVMFLALARPELWDTRPGWGTGLTAHTTMQLHPLSPEDAHRLAANLLPALEDLPSAADRVVGTAEGNPLFIEELAASLHERVDDAASGLPTNVKTTIAARLDTLPPGPRSTLLDAAVVGKVFWRGALLAIEDGSRTADLDDALDLLETRDFVRRESSSQIQGDREYTFKHMLIREVAYSTLPRAARRERHAAVARFVQDAAGERIGEAAAVLAHHWREAGDHGRALDCLLVAAEQATRGWAKGEAVSLYRQALELVPEDQPDLRRHVTLLQAATMVDLGDLTGGIPLLDELLPQLEGRDRLSAMLTRSRAAFWTMDAPTTTRLAKEAVALAERLDDKEFLGPATALQSNATSMEGRLEEAFELNERAFALWQPGKRQTEFAVAMDQRALDHYWAGQYEEGVRWAGQGLALAEEIKSTESILRIGAIYGVLLTALGRHEEALPIFEDTIARGKEVELEPRWTARVMNMSSVLYRDVFDLEESRRRNTEAAELGARAGFAIAEVQAGIDLLFADLMEGEVGRAESRWAKLWERTEAAKGWHQWLMAGRLLEARAEIALAAGDAEAAAGHAEEAIQESAAVWRLKYETSAREVLGSALVRMGQAEQGVGELRAALDASQRLRTPSAIWRAWSDLGDALLATGDETGAASAFAEAKRTIQVFAAALAPERAERLLAVHPIREILGKPGG